MALASLVAAAGCGKQADGESTDSIAKHKSDSSAAVAAAVPHDTSCARSVNCAAAADSSAKARRGADSANLLANAVRLPRRSQSDSISMVAAIRAGLRSTEWPVHTPTTLPGSLLPGRRIVAFYGNPHSPKMGILGEIPPDQMLAKLDEVVGQWRAADPTVPVEPALHLIAVVAQDNPGKDSLYRMRMDTSLIDEVYGWAKSRHAVLFLDIQAGLSTLQDELPRLLPYMAMPDVHLGIDPEFYMHYNRQGRHPGEKIGALDASDVNWVIARLDSVVARNHLPPKVLIVHRFTKNMLQHAEDIHPTPRVQVVINMDGWGQPWLKFDTYKACEVDEPVEYTGFKLFFHNDTKKGDPLLTPREVLALRPRPLYIQYQ